MRNKFKTTSAAALLVTGLAATALFAQEPPAEPRSDEPAASTAEQPAHGRMGGMGMGMNMMDGEMRAQMTRMMENCNRMMERSLEEAPAGED